MSFNLRIYIKPPRLRAILGAFLLLKDPSKSPRQGRLSFPVKTLRQPLERSKALPLMGERGEGLLGVGSLFPENHIHQCGDVGNRDLMVAVHVGCVAVIESGGVFAEDDVDECSHIGNGHLAVAVHITH